MLIGFDQSFSQSNTDMVATYSYSCRDDLCISSNAFDRTLALETFDEIEMPSSFSQTKTVVVEMPRSFDQKQTVVDGLQLISSSGELFNHVDESLPMWAGYGDRTVEVKVLFDSAFEEAPIITLGLTGIDASYDQNLRFSLNAKAIRSTDFTIEFTTWDDTHIARASVSWQAVGQAKSFSGIYASVS